MEAFIIKYWLEFLLGALAGLFASFYAKACSIIRKHESDNKLIIHSLKILIREKIIEIYWDCKKKKNCSLEVRDIIYSLYDEYNNIGGNGNLKDLIDELFDMPVK